MIACRFTLLLDVFECDLSLIQIEHLPQVACLAAYPIANLHNAIQGQRMALVLPGRLLNRLLGHTCHLVEIARNLSDFVGMRAKHVGERHLDKGLLKACQTSVLFKEENHMLSGQVIDEKVGCHREDCT